MAKFTDDPRSAVCACGWGEGENKSAAAVMGHRGRRTNSMCSLPIVFLDGTTAYRAPAADPPDDDDDETEDGERSDEAPSVRNGAGPSVQQVEPMPRGVKRGGASATRGDLIHTGEFTPVRGTFTFSALMHAYYDWFVRGDGTPGGGFEGDFQTWVSTMVLECLQEHYNLTFGVQIIPRVRSAESAVHAGGSNGRHS